MSTKKQKKGFVRAQVQEALTPGEMLRTIRELQELSQRELAQAAGLTQSNISAIETGARNMGRERALALAKALRVHPAVLLFPDFDMAQVA